VGGSGCEASVWFSDSGAVCKITGGVGGSFSIGWGVCLILHLLLELEAALLQILRNLLSHLAAATMESVGPTTLISLN